MIVGMCVKNAISDEQIVTRSDGLQMSVTQLLQDKLESTPGALNALPDSAKTVESRLGAPSSGMWPQFNVRFGGGPVKPGALGFSGAGQVMYQGDVLRFKGNRRNSNLGMSRQEENLPLAAIASSRIDGFFVELQLQPDLKFPESIQGIPVRFECVNAQEAAELCELLNIEPGELPNGLSYIHTAPSPLMR
ncbi:MAG: hypothetical protein HC765_05070 [Brachymonas sp.]|nr:hypothetical protein [Brachymonas sp.]